jgi:hypothetical protein
VEAFPAGVVNMSSMRPVEPVFPPQATIPVLPRKLCQCVDKLTASNRSCTPAARVSQQPTPEGRLFGLHRALSHFTPARRARCPSA